MALIVRKPKEGEFELAPQGTHIARCYMVVDEGMQEGTFGVKHKIRIGWELPNELMKDGRPFVISKEYTASLHPDSNLAKDLVSWRGKSFTDEELAGFDIFKVQGAPCMLTVIYNVKDAKTYANVTSVTAVPKGMVIPIAHNAPQIFSIEEPDEMMFKSLPEWLQKKINRISPNDEIPPGHPAGGGGPDFDDQIPF